MTNSAVMVAIPARTIISNSTMFNSTVAPGHLPINPSLTPGFGIAGIILIITGLTYTLIGIRHKLLQVSLSAGYLASAAITVLILYVINSPVSNSIQGAYVVAVVLSGVIVGAAACIFPDVSEGLGTLLGGFCFSMWLLVLKPGGLLTGTGSKVALITVFSLAAFATSFSHMTRRYGLITGISFAGATAVVLGFDCFSRAGLKEFWAYIWNVNDNLFPLGTNTYPLTKAIRAEIAVIIILTVAGIVSQMKLSLIIKKIRKARSTRHCEETRDVCQEEEKTENHVQRLVAAEQGQWEDAYGKSTTFHSDQSQTDSGIGTLEQKGPGSIITSIRNSRDVEIAQMAPISPSIPRKSISNTEIVTVEGSQEKGAEIPRDERPQSTHNIELQQAHQLGEPSLDKIPEHSPPQEEFVGRSWVPEAETEAQLQGRPSIHSSRRISGSDSPSIIPLPFNIPECVDSDQRSTRSSVAGTLADDDQAQGDNKPPEALAFVSWAPGKSHRNSVRFPREPDSEDLGTTYASEEDSTSSVGATVDDLSDDEDPRSRRTTITSSIQGDFNRPECPTDNKITAEDENPSPETLSLSHSTATSACTVGTEILDVELRKQGTEISALARSVTSSSGPRSGHGEVDVDIPQTPGAKIDELHDGAHDAESTVSYIDPRRVSFTKETLPPQLSKIAMSYRTNEWAKHLSDAEAPTREELNFASPDRKLAESPAPVNVQDLQQTGEIPRPARASRTVSQISMTSAKRRSYGLLPFDGAKPRDPSRRSSTMPQTRSVLRTSATPIFSYTIAESPGENASQRSAGYTSDLGNYSAPSVPVGTAQANTSHRSTMIRENSTSGRISSGQYSGSSSEAGSLHRAPFAEDDTMTLAARRNMILQATPQETPAAASRPERQSLRQAQYFNSVQTIDTNAPQRLSENHPLFRPQMAQWRASMQEDLAADVQPNSTLERQRRHLLQERQIEENRRAMDEQNRLQRDRIFDERMRRGAFHEAHREVMRKMQGEANRRL